jgi:hypothetical protein
MIDIPAMKLIEQYWHSVSCVCHMCISSDAFMLGDIGSSLGYDWQKWDNYWHDNATNWHMTELRDIDYKW